MTTSFKKYHRLSGIAVAVFLLIHFTNHLFALGGPSLHISVMKLFRHIYRFPPVEILLLVCILFQIFSGIVLVFKKNIFRQAFPFFMQVVSGLYLSFFMIYHVWAVMMGRYQWHVSTDFYYAAGGLLSYPSKLFFFPYYSLSVMTVFIHVACAHYNRRLERVEPGMAGGAAFKQQYKKEAWWICAAGAAVTLLMIGSFGGFILYDFNETVRIRV